MKNSWRAVALLLGVGMVIHGYSVTQSGLLIPPKFEGAPSVHVGEYALPVGVGLMIMGLYIFYLIFIDIKERW